MHFTSIRVIGTWDIWDMGAEPRSSRAFMTTARVVTTIRGYAHLGSQ